MEHVTSADGTVLALERAGSGPAIVLVCGAISDRSANAALAGELAGHFTVYNYDRRGRGGSGNATPYRLEAPAQEAGEEALAREAEDLAAVVAAAGGRAYAYGISSGGALVLEAAARGVELAGVAVYECPYSPGNGEEGRAYYAELTRLLREGRGGEAAALFLTVAGTPEAQVEQMRREPYWPQVEALAPSLPYDSAALGHGTCGGVFPVERMASLAVPALVLSGGASPRFFHDAARLITATLAGARHEVVAGQDHQVRAAALAPVLVAGLLGKTDRSV
ncbi:alpha/beta fold hydrolase [Nonomuraea sp. NPDC050328]|uniref:alpha/beta fold hydrolase n=1 Tax=Nonomuraea sp. NPDC050328 TaxID=3364361 RepID=UPI00378970DA